MEPKDHFKKLTEFIIHNNDEIRRMAENARNTSAQKAVADTLTHLFHIPYTDAEKTVEELLQGLAKYNGIRHDFAQNGVQSLMELLPELTKDMPHEKSHETYAGILSLMKSMNGNEPLHSDVTDSTAPYRNTNIEDMTSEIGELLDDFPPKHLTDKMHELFVSVELKELSHIWPDIEEHKEDIQLFTAAWMYAAQKETNLVPGNTHLPPQIIGTMAGMGLDILQAVKNMDAGDGNYYLWLMNIIIRSLIMLALHVFIVMTILYSSWIVMINYLPFFLTGMFFLAMIGIYILYLNDIMKFQYNLDDMINSKLLPFQKKVEKFLHNLSKPVSDAVGGETGKEAGDPLPQREPYPEKDEDDIDSENRNREDKEKDPHPDDCMPA